MAITESHREAIREELANGNIYPDPKSVELVLFVKDDAVIVLRDAHMNLEKAGELYEHGKVNEYTVSNRSIMRALGLESTTQLIDLLGTSKKRQSPMLFPLKEAEYNWKDERTLVIRSPEQIGVPLAFLSNGMANGKLGEDGKMEYRLTDGRQIANLQNALSAEGFSIPGIEPFMKRQGQGRPV
jgi:hypothetical protein